ncbi:MAG: CHASE domain-containing protein [Deltaproteobacteria bacterium]|nr:CHASE domain-containing protein [Deltaproteobacteria bacterium]
MREQLNHHNKFSGQALGGGLAVVLAGFILTLIIFWQVRQSELAAFHIRFERDTAMHTELLKKRLDGCLLVVKTIGRFFYVTEQVSAQDFSAFTRPFVAGQVELRALTWVPRVLRSDRARFEAEGRTTIGPDFHIYERDPGGRNIPAGEREAVYPVFYLEPFGKGILPVVGFDMGSDPERLAALERARDTAQPSAIGLLNLAGMRHVPGFVIYVPVYRQGMPIATIDQRREALKGFGLAAFRADLLLAMAMRHRELHGVDVKLLDLSAPPEKHLFHRWVSRLSARDSWFSNLFPVPQTSLQKFSFAGREWGMEFTANPDYLERNYPLAYWLLLPGGGLLTCLLGLYLWTILSQRQRMERLVFERTADLLESEERFRVLVERAPEAIVVFDVDSNLFVDVNANAERLFACPRDELLRSGPERFYPPAQPDTLPVADSIQEHSARTLAGEEMTLVRAIRNAVGQDLLCEVRLVRLPSGGRRLIRGSYIDITERKRAEEALRKSEGKLRAVMNIPSCAIIVQDRNGIVTDGNTTLAKRFGKNIDEIRGCCIWDLLPADVLETRKAIAEEVFRTGRPVRFEDERAGMWNDHTLFPIMDDAGDVLNIAISSIDITERKQAEAERKRLEAQLRQSQKMEAIGTLAGGIAHDFNNILSAVFGYTQLALDDPGVNQVIREYLEEILKSAKRARDLVKQILTVSRQSEQEMIPFEITPVIEESTRLIRASLPANIIIKQKISDQQPVILGDPTQIHQVLINLCTNAAHAMQESGGVLEIRLNEFSLDIDSAARYINLQPGPYLKLSVSDTGHGMESKIIDRIFDPFFTTKEIGKGTGMGLAIVHGIVMRHGGAINVYSEPGQGATFNILLPILKDQAEFCHDDDAVAPTGMENILLVDDEPELVDVGQKILGQLGYHVTAMTNGLTALEAFREHPDQFDLLITDMAMPNITGDKLAGEIMTIRPDFPIILCTGFSESVNEEKAKQIGIRGFIMKPIDTNNLARLIRRVLGQ